MVCVEGTLKLIRFQPLPRAWTPSTGASLWVRCEKGSECEWGNGKEFSRALSHSASHRWVPGSTHGNALPEARPQRPLLLLGRLRSALTAPCLVSGGFGGVIASV